MKRICIMIQLTATVAAVGCVPAEVQPQRPDAGLKAPDAATSPDAGVPDASPQDASAGPDATVDAGADPHDAGLADALPLPDRDNDGIPDGEDPEPDRGNPLLLNDSFTTRQPDWIFSSVSMEIDPQSSLLSVSAIEPFEREGWIGPRPAWGDYFIRSLIKVDAVGRSGDARSGHAGLIARVNQVTPSRYVTCGVDLKQHRVVLAEHEGTRRSTLAEAPSDAESGQWLLLNFTAFRNAYACEVGGVRVEGASEIFNSGSVGFRSYDATFAADWIEVYEILP